MFVIVKSHAVFAASCAPHSSLMAAYAQKEKVLVTKANVTKFARIQ